MFNLILWILKLFFLALLYLFLIYLLRLVFKDLSLSTQAEEAPLLKPSGKTAPSPGPGYEVEARLVVLEGPLEAGKTFYLGKETLMGRSSQSDLELKDNFVSLDHARVFKDQDKFILEDLGSTNGTFLGEEKLGKPRPLKTGDRIRVGQTVLEFLE